MSGEALQPGQLQAWREQGADLFDPVRFRFIEALQRRASTHSGAARRLLDKRLEELLADYATRLQQHGQDTGGARNPGARRVAAAVPAPSAGQRRSRIATLNAHAAANSGAAPVTPAMAARNGDDREAVPDAPLRTLPKLQALDDFKRLWTQVHTDSKLRQSLDEAPENAGPLNSGQLVFRTLTLVSELSPGYLQQFLLYADTLSWLQAMSSTSAEADGAASERTGLAKKRSRKKKT